MADLFGEDDEDQVQEPQEGEEEEEDILDMDGGGVVQNGPEALLMRFCPHDSSMLYPQVMMIVCSKRSFYRLSRRMIEKLFCSRGV